MVVVTIALGDAVERETRICDTVTISLDAEATSNINSCVTSIVALYVCIHAINALQRT